MPRDTTDDSKRPRLVETDADRAERDRLYNDAGRELLSFIDRCEAHDAERGEAQAAMQAVLAEAKSRGYDPKALKVILAERKADKAKLAELKAVLDTYRLALGM